MRFSSLFLLGASVCSILCQADPLQTEHLLPSHSSVEEFEKEDFTLSLADDESSLFEQEMEKFEEEILALEEELKKDAESLIEDSAQEVVTTQEPVIISDSIVENLASASDSSESMHEEMAPTEEMKTEVIAETPSLNAEIPVLAVEAPAEAKDLNVVSKEIQSPHIANEIAVAETLPKIEESPATLNIDADQVEKKNSPIEVNLEQAFQGSPVIYSVLLGMSVLAFGIWLYSLFCMQRSVRVSSVFIKNVKNKLSSNHFDDALALCTHYENLIGKMVASGIQARRHGLPIMIESMKAEGKRASVHFWQRLGLLNDIAVLAPMLGLLGTVLGMFYAFYDVNRSIESVSTLFDGLGVSVGTTVAGLLVAILALILHSIAKYRLVRALATVENEAQSLATLIDDRSSEYRG